MLLSANAARTFDFYTSWFVFGIITLWKLCARSPANSKSPSGWMAFNPLLNEHNKHDWTGGVVSHEYIPRSYPQLTQIILNIYFADVSGLEQKLNKGFLWTTEHRGCAETRLPVWLTFTGSETVTVRLAVWEQSNHMESAVSASYLMVLPCLRFDDPAFNISLPESCGNAVRPSNR